MAMQNPCIGINYNCYKLSAFEWYEDLTKPKPKNINDIKRYIINKNVAVIIWSDNTKTISYKHEEDTFDKELGFLLAYFYKRWGRSKAATKRVINSINEDKIKTFLIEFFARDNKDVLPYEKVKNYLHNLKVEEK